MYSVSLLSYSLGSLGSLTYCKSSSFLTFKFETVGGTYFVARFLTLNFLLRKEYSVFRPDGILADSRGGSFKMFSHLTQADTFPLQI